MMHKEITYAIYINDPKKLDLLKKLNPEIKDVPYEDVHRYYYVLDFPTEGSYCFMPATGFKEMFANLADGPYLTTDLVYKK